MAHYDHPRLSVIIPLYNHERFVGEAIESVLAQSFSDFELIVINDGSTDRSEAIVKNINDDRIKYFSQTNQGASYTLNRGIQLTCGEYVSILNSDDAYCRTRFDEAVRLLDGDRSLEAVFSHIEVIDSEGTSLRFLRGAEENWLQHDAETSFKGSNDMTLDLLGGNFLMTSSNLFCRRAVFEAIGNFENLRYTHDYDFFLRLCHRCHVTVIERPLLKYRTHAANSLKQSEADVKFEIGLLLTRFLLDGGLERVYRHEPREDVALVKLFNSIAACETEKMMVSLLLSAYGNRDGKDKLFSELAKNRESVFRRTCITSLKQHVDLWQHSQDAWRHWAEMNERLTEYRRSYPYRIWRALTWPRRKLSGKAQSLGKGDSETTR